MGQLDKSANHIAAMFDGIAAHYDFLNHFLSLGIDKRWRSKLVRVVAQQQPAKILDIATGTGDLAIALHKKTNAAVTGIDISEKMLDIARSKQSSAGSWQLAVGNTDTTCRLPTENGPLKTVNFLAASAEALPFPDCSFEAVTVAFGVRNFEQLSLGLQEAFRVLKAGGTLAILEFAMPVHAPIKQLYKFYFHFVLPRIGRLFSKHRSAYSYLPASVAGFPQRSDFVNLLKQAGFSDAGYTCLTCGIAMLYVAKKRALRAVAPANLKPEI